MKRVIAVLASASFVVAIGCSDYDIRMGKTLEEMRYAKRLNTNLEEAPTKGTLQGDDIFVRPPKGLLGPTQAFSLTGVDPGKFDIENSFIDEKKGTSLHVVARVKKPKPPPSAKKAAAPVETVPRGKFIDDVVELVKAAYNVELAPGQFKNESKSHLGRENAYKAAKLLELATKQVEVYVYTESNGVREVALIFEFPKTELNYMNPKIDLCLESLAVGDRAKRSFEGTISDMDAGGGEAIGTGAPPPI